jgi:hypothetical protein
VDIREKLPGMFRFSDNFSRLPFIDFYLFPCSFFFKCVVGGGQTYYDVAQTALELAV